MKCFVTGGTGFVGANLIRLLVSQGYTVKALVRPHSCLDNLTGLEVETVTATLNDEALAQQLRGCQVLFHVAAHYSLWRRDGEALYQSNVLGTRNILAAARAAGIERTVYTSSVAAIGVPADGHIADETYQSPPEKLIGAYKKSKYWAEQEAHKASDQGQDIVIVNPSTPIGPWDIKPTPTGEIILRFLRRQMPAYLDTGLNLIDVRDVAQGHLQALHRGKTGHRYILGNQNLSLQDILHILADLTGLPAPRYAVPFWIPLIAAWIDEYVLAALGKSPTVPVSGVQMARQNMFYCSDRAIQTLGLPQTPIRQALADAVTWFQTHGYVPASGPTKGIGA
ncbi:hopanoid-associated sugar epimerase [Lyngbya confervoides]|uniref:NAD-dependent epimerase/dehydratase family protein n=1 Tax=Lyngbya confervoides BDU141951 TaxID=1574623 RepID=A0ABD4T5E3_9CYAN|nr:hopanoid-associated sugar epimerase [Lyngbya confervoides]MCM1983927.1 NAD-dependent epimerase/dehydratase family protein [Lyngbya confervoides BDU141951]